MSLVHIIIIYKIVSILSFRDFGSNVLAFTTTILIWLILQGTYASIVLGMDFITPFAAVWKLITNPKILFMTFDKAKVLGEHVASPV